MISKNIIRLYDCNYKMISRIVSFHILIMSYEIQAKFRITLFSWFEIFIYKNTTSINSQSCYTSYLFVHCIYLCLWKLCMKCRIFVKDIDFYYIDVLCLLCACALYLRIRYITSDIWFSHFIPVVCHGNFILSIWSVFSKINIKVQSISSYILV